MKTSFIYRNIFIYRLLMSVLYGFNYKKRFLDVIKHIPQDSIKVLELCFGDIYIAEYCISKNMQWTGIDINKKFINYAVSKGYDARFEDISNLERFPKADVLIMMGSFYHFHGNAESLLSRMLAAAETVIISEPVVNLSNVSGIIGKIAKKSADAGKGHENFRYNAESFSGMLEDMRLTVGFEYKIASKKRDMVAVLTK